MCSRTDICVCTYTGERSGDIELSSLDAQLSDDAPIADSANDSANDQLTVAQPVGTLSGACPFAVGFGEFFSFVYHLRDQCNTVDSVHSYSSVPKSLPFLYNQHTSYELRYSLSALLLII